MKDIKTQIISTGTGKNLEVSLDGKEYILPFKVLGGKTVAFLDMSGMVSFTESAAEELTSIFIEKGVTFDTILNPVSKSSALAHAIAVRWAQKKDPSLTNTVVARKSSSPQNFETTYRSVTTQKEQTLSLTDDDAAYIKGKKVLVIDDVYGAGGTSKALYELVNKAGGIISAHAVAAIEQGASIPEGLIYLFELPTI